MLHTHDIAVRGLEGLNDSAAENSGDDLMAQAHSEDRFGTDEAFRCDPGSPVGRGSARSGGKDHCVRIGKATTSDSSMTETSCPFALSIATRLKT